MAGFPQSAVHAVMPIAGAPNQRTVSVSERLSAILCEIGVRQAFGLVGGAIAPLSDALANGRLQIVHCRHEGGAAFAAMEAYFAGGAPAAVFVTTGPGLLNALTGVMAARSEGAKLVLISGMTSARQRGRGATQETSLHSMPMSGIYSSGPFFDYAEVIEDPAQLELVASRLKVGMARPGGFVAHIALPIALQTMALADEIPAPAFSAAAPECSPEAAARCAALLQQGSFAVWVGFGARHASQQVRDLVERSDARVLCSPRAKGIFPEDDARFIGVTGMGGHDSAPEYMVQSKPDRLLVLGTRLGEATSFWDTSLLPSKEIIHVDIDDTAFGAAFPKAKTVGVRAELKTFLSQLNEHFPERRPRRIRVRQKEDAKLQAERGRVRPVYLMQQIQEQIVEDTDFIVMAESGNAFAWTNTYLKFLDANRYRVSVGFGSMGHFSAGVMGAALAMQRKAIAVVGDGSMMMNNEINTAVQYGARAVWIVLNDARYGIVEQAMRAQGLTPVESVFPEADFVAVARAFGADGIRVETEAELSPALRAALEAPGPFVVDVLIDHEQKSPVLKRVRSLIKQGASRAGGSEP